MRRATTAADHAACACQYLCEAIVEGIAVVLRYRLHLQPCGGWAGYPHALSTRIERTQRSGVLDIGIPPRRRRGNAPRRGVHNPLLFVSTRDFSLV